MGCAGGVVAAAARRRYPPPARGQRWGRGREHGTDGLRGARDGAGGRVLGAMDGPAWGLGPNRDPPASHGRRASATGCRGSGFISDASQRLASEARGRGGIIAQGNSRENRRRRPQRHTNGTGGENGTAQKGSRGKAVEVRAQAGRVFSRPAFPDRNGRAMDGELGAPWMARMGARQGRRAGGAAQGCAGRAHGWARPFRATDGAGRAGRRVGLIGDVGRALVQRAKRACWVRGSRQDRIWVVEGVCVKGIKNGSDLVEESIARVPD